MKLKDKVILVTGASRGIGFGIVKKLASEGAHVIINAVNPEGVAKAVDKLKQEFPNQKIIGIPANISTADGVQILYDKTMENFDRIDGLVNNAGVTRDNLMMRMKEEDWNSVIDINLKSAFFVTKAFIRPMMKTGGKIVMMSSVVGEIGNAGQSNYAASKGGMIAMAKSLAREFAGKNINVNTVTPGFIRTEMTEVLSEEVMSNILAGIPKKKVGEVKDIANAVSFLLSDEADYITGQVLGVNGGMSMA